MRELIGTTTGAAVLFLLNLLIVSSLPRFARVNRCGGYFKAIRVPSPQA